MPQIPAYPAKTVPSNGDLLVIHDSVAGNTKNITRGNLLSGAPLPNNTVTTAAISDSSITTAKLADASVTAPKLKPDYYTISAGSLTLTATLTDIPSSSISVTVTTPSVIWIHYFASITQNQTAATLVLDIGGSSVSSTTTQNPAADNTIIGTARSHFFLASVGTHTIKLRANRGAGGTGSIATGQSGITCVVFAQ